MALRTYLTGIADAIREKKGTTDPINAQDFASEISSISTGGSDENPLQTLVTGRGIYGGYYLFYKYNGPADLISTLDFSLVTDASYMFSKISNKWIPQLTTLNNVTNANYMFSQAAALQNLEAFNTSSITNMQAMFEQCTSLESLFPMNTNAATTMRFMFSSCYRLKTIDITKLASECGYMASTCYSLTKFIIRTMDTLPTFGSSMFNQCYHFTGTQHYLYNPDGLQDGRIYVPDAQVDALKAATGWSAFADIIVPLSTLVED